MTTKPKTRIPLYTLYTTFFVSATGDAMAAIAIPWFVLETTGSAAKMGIAAFFSITPIVLAMFFGGTIVDRTGYKQTSVLADVASGITMALIPLLYVTIGLAFWQLLLLVFLGNLLDAPGRSARQAMLPELAEAAATSIDRATGITQAVSRATGMLGAPIAGILIIFIGATGVLAVNAATFLVSAVGILLFIPTSLVDTRPEDESSKGYWADMKDGFQFVQQDSLLLMFIIVIMITNMVDAAMSGVTLPIFAEEVYGSAVSLGLMVGIFGASAFIGTLIYSWRGERFSRRAVFIISFMIVAIRFFLFMTYPPFWLLLVMIALTGVWAGPINPIISVISYERIPANMRARVFGLLSAGVLVAMPLGAVVAGYLLEIFGIRWMLFIYGVIYLLATGSMLFNPTTAEMDNKPKQDANLAVEAA